MESVDSTIEKASSTIQSHLMEQSTPVSYSS
jgi:hypothetical protein